MMFGKKKNHTDALEPVTELAKAEKPKKETKPANKKKRKRVIALAAVIIILALLYVRGRMAASVLPVVETAAVERGTVSSELSTNGTVEAETVRVYASPVSAEVAEVRVKTGDLVNAGDSLVLYDTASLENSYSLADLQAKSEQSTNNDSLNKSAENQTKRDNAQNTINTLQGQIDSKNGEIGAMQTEITNNTIAQTNITAAISSLTEEIQSLSANTERTDAQESALKKKQADLKSLQDQATAVANALTSEQASLSILQNQLTDLTSQKSTAEAEKSSAEAGILSESQKASISYSNQISRLNVTTAGDELSKASAGVNADYAGIVTEVNISEGAAASEGMALVSVADTSDMKVEIQVSKYDLEELKEGQKAQITLLGNTYEGTVENISRLATTGSSGAKMVNASVHIDNPDENLILGLDAKIVISLGTAENVLTVPLTAVNTDKDGNFVYAVENGIVVKKPVTTGLTSNSSVEIVSGLEEGDRIITLVDATIIEGMMVDPGITTENTGADSTEQEPADAAAGSEPKSETAGSTEQEKPADQPADSTEQEPADKAE